MIYAQYSALRSCLRTRTLPAKKKQKKGLNDQALFLLFSNRAASCLQAVPRSADALQGGASVSVIDEQLIPFYLEIRVLDIAGLIDD